MHAIQARTWWLHGGGDLGMGYAAGCKLKGVVRVGIHTHPNGRMCCKVRSSVCVVCGCGCISRCPRTDRNPPELAANKGIFKLPCVPRGSRQEPQRGGLQVAPPQQRVSLPVAVHPAKGRALSCHHPLHQALTPPGATTKASFTALPVKCFEFRRPLRLDPTPCLSMQEWRE
jgi:hypothetical protein